MKHLLQRKISVALSMILVVLIFSLLIEGAIEGRWGAIFSGVGAVLLALILWFFWVVHFVWLLSKSPHILGIGKSTLVAFIFGVSLLIVAGKTAGQFKTIGQDREIKPAINAGLYKDCMQLMQSWSTNQVCIYCSDTNFAQLPTSIKMLKPVYVENCTDPNPSNIGICKNGFGGFAIGIRVFQNDSDAMEFSTNTVGEYRRVAPGIYIWHHPT